MLQLLLFAAVILGFLSGSLWLFTVACASSDLMGPIDSFSKRHVSASCFSSLDC